LGKNGLAAGVVGFVLALALAGMGYLFFLSPTEGDRERDPVSRPAPRAQRQTPAAGDVNLASARSRGPIDQPAAPEVAPATTTLSEADLRTRIQEILQEYDRVANAVAGASGSLGDEQIRSLREREQRITELVKRLAALGPDAIPILLEVMEQDGRTGRIDRQTLLVRALGTMGGPEAVAALGKALDMTQQWGLRMSIVSQLAQHGGAEGLELLADRLAIEPDARVRGAILKFVGQQRTPEAAALAARLARSDQDANVRIAAIRALGDAGDIAIAAPVLEELARTGDNLAVRQNAVQVYGRLMREQGIPLLEDLLRGDPNLRIRSVAILSLQEIGGQQATAALQAAANDPLQSEDVRARARGALAALERMERGGAPAIGTRIQGLKPVRVEGLKPIGELGQDDN
jgi:HEAT repeat protein